MYRALLSQKYFTGLGVEIGPGSSPWMNPNEAKIAYIDKDPTVTSNYKHILEVETSTLDFVCHSHTFEHFENPVYELQTQIRALKKGGKLVMAIPNMEKTFDKTRHPTSFEHLLKDHLVSGHLEATRLDHFKDFALCTSPNQGSLNALLSSTNYGGIHYHCWTEHGLKDLFYRLAPIMGFKVLSIDPEWIEVFVVLEKE